MQPDLTTILNRRMAIRRERGQTIIVAMIILGLLLILGFVFIGIINRSINTSGVLQRRSRANDLSEAGIRYAHQQLLQSEQGADWRGLPTPLEAGNFTRDPDAFFLRPPSGFNWPGSGALDRGGPDGLGPFFRVPFQGGRALVRVSWAPSDPNIFRTKPTGALRSPGAARNYILIEAVGREGNVNVNDPTTLSTRTSRQYRNYGSSAAFQQELNAFRSDQSRYGGIQVNRAFASIGIIETARFITNKYRVSTPADLGVPSDLGAMYRGQQVNDLMLVLGSSVPLLTFEGPGSPASPAGLVPANGSLFSNADLHLHGRIVANLNMTLGDQFDVAGSISGDDDSVLQVVPRAYDSASKTYQPLPGATDPGNSVILGPNGTKTFNSQSPYFLTVGALVRDGSTERGADGGPRGVGYKAPPSILALDTQTHTNRYVQMTRESGVLVNGRNSGVFGYGQGLYVNNSSDRQSGSTEAGRLNLGGEGSLINDWLNPSNREGGAWRGFFYVPPGAYVQLLTDGFIIMRDGRAPQEERTWRMPDGTDSGLAALRFRLGRGTDRRLHLVNQFEGADVNGPISATTYDRGQPFNGVLYFEGNARVRGTIPTDVQLTLVSGATIYIEGSITKGVSGNDWTATYTSEDGLPATSQGTRLTRPSRSMLMLMAKDYIAVNTTQFFGPTPGQDVQPKEDVPNLPSFNPVLVRTGGSLTMRSESILDPYGPNVTNSANPSQWRPFEADYVSPNNTSQKIATKILSSQAMDEGPGEQTFVAWDVNPGFASPSYLFPSGPNPPYANGAAPYFGGTNIPLYGLGTENYQRFGKFESNVFPYVDPASTNVDATTGNMTSTGSRGGYLIFAESPNDINIRLGSAGSTTTNDYVLGRMALAPHDIRIEAAMFAEEGSFFVIPGPWFNPNPNDTFERWDRPDDADGTTTLTDAEKNARRLEEFGSAPEMPFYGEPLDNRIVIVGSVSENMPPTASQQAEWIRKWGWIPRFLGASSETIPAQHLGSAAVNSQYVPNIIINYDPMLATGRRYGFSEPLNDPATYVRTQWVDYNQDGIQQTTELLPLPPAPRLPVSPTLAYFGEVH